MRSDQVPEGGDARLDRVVDVLRRPVALDAGIDGRVLAVLRQDAARAHKARWPRLTAIAAGLVAVAGAGLTVARHVGSHSPVGRVVGAAVAKPVQFVLVAPASSKVAVVGDFNDWDPSASPLSRAPGDGVWTVRIPLVPGRYRYSFLVDGQTWVRDSTEPPAVENDFDKPTSVITVSGGAT